MRKPAQLSYLEAAVELVFLAIDPNTGGDNCPAVFVEEETGDLLFQGWTVTDAQTLTEVSRYSPVADDESVVRLPGADARDHPGGAQWPRCHRSAN